MASSTSRIEVERGRPPGYTGIKGSTRAHCSSVRSLGYRCVRIPTTYEKHPSRTASEWPRQRTAPECGCQGAVKSLHETDSDRLGERSVHPVPESEKL